MNRLRVSILGVMGIAMVTGLVLALKLLITLAGAGGILLDTHNSSTIDETLPLTSAAVGKLIRVIQSRGFSVAGGARNRNLVVGRNGACPSSA
jgi:hypothetical protein